MSASSGEALVRMVIDLIWNQGQLDVADDLFAVDYVNHGGVIADLVSGPEAIKISAALHRVAFPDLHVVVEELTTDQETVVLRWTATAGVAGRGEESGVAPGLRLLTGMTRCRIVGGTIVESWTEW
jgi:hypothetical protein